MTGKDDKFLRQYKAIQEFFDALVEAMEAAMKAQRINSESDFMRDEKQLEELFEWIEKIEVDLDPGAMWWVKDLKNIMLNKAFQNALASGAIEKQGESLLNITKHFN